LSIPFLALKSLRSKQELVYLALLILGQQLRHYEAMFEELAAVMGELVNRVQREASREFTPVIARNLALAHEKCAAESGELSLRYVFLDSC
jgi:hypothetical protein